ncbi:MAG TPA: diguanylate cyclase [Candidatus Saccharimonadales bacterium]|nr:diguanylate cyclase [Candidatus Saccharimonadales bacterium]
MQRIAILYDASQAVLSTFDLDEVLNQVLAIARDYFHLQNGSIMLLDEKSQSLFIRAQFGETHTDPTFSVPFGKGITGAAAKARRPIYSPDVTTDSRYIPYSSNTRSELAIPLIVRDQVVGVLDCESDKPRFFDNETVDLLTLFATQASIGLQNAKLYSMLQGRAAQLEAINALAKRTTVELDLKELLDHLCSQLPRSFPVEHVAIFLRDEEGDLVLRAQEGALETKLNVGDAVPQVYARNTGGEAHSPHSGDPSEFVATCFPTALEEVRLPLVSFGENVGLLVCLTTKKNAFLANDIQALESVADILATASQNARYVEGVRQLAYRDGLTGVFNRRYFETRLIEEVTRAARYGGGVSVLMIDLDHFKRINDEFGHLLGDDVLRTISEIFIRQLRKIDIVCRYGGEEFAVVLPATQGVSAVTVADKLRRAVANAKLPGVPYPVTISIGVAEFPGNGIDRDDIVGAADASLYEAKAAGRNRVCLASASKISAVSSIE